jgi:SAM-dependent methyltransferase
VSREDFSSRRMLGGHSPLDGTVEFYGRINAILKPEFVVVDLGAGRGAWHADPPGYGRSLRLLKGRVSRVIGLDVDAAVLANPSTDENVVIEGDVLPLGDASADLVIADYVLEHVQDPAAFERELFRVLKPGGVFCARTPHSLHYVSVGARLARLAGGSRVLTAAQPSREARDAFPTRYRCNTLRQLDAIWNAGRWSDHSYLYTAEPSYHFGSQFVYRVLHVFHKILPLPFVGNIFVFKVKRIPAC